MVIKPGFPRLMALFLCAVPLCVCAATPSNGSLTPASGNVSYSAGPFTIANPTPVPVVDVGPSCDAIHPCDSYTLTVTVPAGYMAVHPFASAKITARWTDTGSGNSDYDLYAYRGVVGNTNGGTQPSASSASGNNPEVTALSPLVDGDNKFTIKLVPYTPTGETVNVTLQFLPGPDSGGSGGGTFGAADPAAPGAPRYQNFYAPNGTSAQPGSGEFNIGFNPHSGRIMTMNAGPIWRLTPAEVEDPAAPESCEAKWEDKSSTVTDTGLDPILWTDQKSGRTFASNSTVGANAVYAYSDNDGDNWIPFGIGAPNGGADHQSIGTGPLPASLASLLTTPLNQGQFGLYCSQDIVGPAFCQVSLDLGITWGQTMPAYTGQGPGGCGGLHGHAHIAPDGTAWLPVKNCAGGTQGGAISTDAGTSWTEFKVPGAQSQTPHGGDPSIAIDADSTAYYCTVENAAVPAGNPAEGHVHVHVSHDRGQTWTDDFDIGASHGIKNAAQPEAVGGSSGRAACGFLGTDKPGDYEAQDFPGKWYAYIATTYDGGKTWITVNATPNDPVQSKSGIWQGGGGNQNRNLLDFNEITIDDKGRVLYGYSDGCVSEACIDGSGPNDFVAHMRVARQSGGKTLLAGFDAQTDTVQAKAPRRACAAGSRDQHAAHVTWKAPDNGGSEISSYSVFRSDTAGGAQTLLGTINGNTTKFDDVTADPAKPDYFYTVRASNGSGVGAASNEVKLLVVTPPDPGNVCTLPGLSKLIDGASDTTNGTGLAPPGADLLSLQLAQPFSATSDADAALMFTLTTDSGLSPQVPGSAWYVAMKILNAGPAETYRYKGVHMVWNGATPTFESYTPSSNNGGTVDGRFVESGSEIVAEGTYETPFNKVVIKARLSDLGLQPGDVIVGFVSGTSQTAAGVATALLDQMPDSLGFGESGPYTVNSNQACNADVLFRNGFE